MNAKEKICVLKRVIQIRKLKAYFANNPIYLIKNIFRQTVRFRYKQEQITEYLPPVKIFSKILGQAYGCYQNITPKATSEMLDSPPLKKREHK